MGAISTGMVVVLGIIVVLPAFMQKSAPQTLDFVLLFRIHGDDTLPSWCDDLSAVLEKHGVPAVVLVAGNLADRRPACVSDFVKNSRVDIGSQTYSYVGLASILDYSYALLEVERGKQAVDAAGQIESRLFGAPYGSVDAENIYSMLSRSGITADFSYADHYNLWQNDGDGGRQFFVRHDAAGYDGSQHTPEFFFSLEKTDTPVIIHFDSSSVSVAKIDEFVRRLESGNPERYHIRLSNASDLAGEPLTIRGGGS
jgi:hypothetical protein